MRIVLRPRHALHLSRRHQFTHQNIAPSLYPLPTVVGELHLLLVELDAVAKDAEHGTRTHDIVVKALFLQRIVLRQTSFIDQIHRLLHRIADVLVIGSKRKEVMVEKVKVTSDYFNTLTQNEHEPKLIKAIIDEDVKATDGSRVRLRLLDDIEIGETVVKKGSYLYATMSGFGSQRVKGSINSILVDDELIKVSLSLYDTDGLEGLYVPGSQFRETTKDVASGAMQSNMNIDQSGANNSFSQWGMQAVTNAYQKTSNAISKAIKKNKVKLKYGTFVYLVNGKEKRK